MELPTISQEDFIRISLEGYTNKSTELTRKGIFVSLIEIEKRTYAIAEVRFTKPHPLQYLTDAE
jgi:putative N-acetylmannosamine-6-phosphate epimerase